MDAKTTAQATTNSYVSLLKVKAPNFEDVTFVVYNSDDADDMDIKILVSNDPAGSAASFTALELDSVGNTELTIGETESKPFYPPPFHWYDIQVKSTVADNHAVANAWAHAR